ncbi:MAG: sensor histidine kinase, partial [Blastocatellia bacterium]
MNSIAPASWALPLFPPLADWFPSGHWSLLFAPALAVALSVWFHRRKRAPEPECARMRMASDLHDDIGANLTQIIVLAEVLRRQHEPDNPQLAASLAAIARISGETAEALGDLVWATNPQHDSLTNLARRMRRFASEILPAASIEFSFSAPPPENDLRLAPELRRQLYLIFKESLNNIVRHARCTQATIELRVEDAHLSLRILDNGRGIGAAREGNGLPGLRRRAQSLGGELTISSVAGGTAISLRAPLSGKENASDTFRARQWLIRILVMPRTYL